MMTGQTEMQYPSEAQAPASAHTTLADRFGLLSYAALLWLPVGVLFGVLWLLESALASDPGDDYISTPDEMYAPLIFLFPLVLALLATFVAAWFGTWGFICLAAFGRDTTTRHWSLDVVGSRDWVLFGAGSVACTLIVLSLADHTTSWLARAVFLVMPVAVLLGVGNVLYAVAHTVIRPMGKLPRRQV
jgi:hypothetical protein